MATASLQSLKPEVAEIVRLSPSSPLPPQVFHDEKAAAEYLRVARSGVGREPGARLDAVHLVQERSLRSDLQVRVYVPAAEGTFPAVVFFHGGGWVLGNLDMHDGLCRRLCNQIRAAIVNVHYRLAPEYPFPAALDDGIEVLHWIIDGHSGLPVDDQRIAVVGTSAGGNLAAGLALRCRDEGIGLALQVLAYPVLDPRMDSSSYEQYREGPVLTAEQMGWYWDQYVPRPQDRIDPYAAPALAGDVNGVAPALLLVPECDPLRDEAEQYGRRLQAAGVAVEVERYPGQIHSFLRYLDVLSDANDAVARISSAACRAFCHDK